MPRPKGSKNKKTLAREGKLVLTEEKIDKPDPKADKVEEKKAVIEWNKATASINDLVKRASEKGALISDTGPIPYPKS